MSYGEVFQDSGACPKLVVLIWVPGIFALFVLYMVLSCEKKYIYYRGFRNPPIIL